MFELVVDFSRGETVQLLTPTGGSDGETAYTTTECRMILLGRELNRSLERHGMNDLTITVLLNSGVEPQPGGILILKNEEYRLRQIARCLNIDGELVCYRCVAG